MPTKIILIRHGQTDWSRQRRYCGFSDISLNKKGRGQAKMVSKRLRELNVHKIYSSDLKRAYEFSKLIFKGMRVKKLPELREINFGVFEGLSYQKIMDRYPKVYKKWLNDPVRVKIPEGESLNGLSKRVRRALSKIISLNKDRTVALFTHAGPIRVILCDSLRRDLKDLWQIEAKLGSINIVEFTNG